MARRIKTPRETNSRPKRIRVRPFWYIELAKKYNEKHTRVMLHPVIKDFFKKIKKMRRMFKQSRINSRAMAKN